MDARRETDAGGLRARVFGLILLGAGLLPLSAQAQALEASGPDRYRFVEWTLEDVGALVTPGWEAAAIVGGTGAVVLALMPYDSLVTGEATAWRERSNPYLVRAVEEIGNVHAARPVALMLFVGTLFTDDRKLQDAAFTSLEAVVLADLTTRALKRLFGRSRPFEGEGPHRFRPFTDATAFPSGHSTVAFALVTPWVVYYPRPWSVGLLALSAGTAFSRILVNYHWLTDTLAGATVGTAMGVALARRHLRREAQGVEILPTGQGGAGLTLRLRF